MDTSATASLSFEPGVISSKVGETFQVALNVFTDSSPVISTDVWITYNPELIEPVLPVTKGETFETLGARIITPGRLYVYGIQSDKYTLKTANGSLATLKFKSLRDGSTSLGIECSPTTNTGSQIIMNSDNLENIINCTRTANHTATIAIKGNVLGASDVSPGMNMTYLTVTVLMLLFTTFLFIKYRSQKTPKTPNHQP